jgi:hypothetical protein
MGNLKYVITLPSIDISSSVEISDLILVGLNDSRYKEARKSSPNLSAYLDRFKTPFGSKLKPSIVLRYDSLPKINSEILSSFRNAIAVSSVIESRVMSYKFHRTTGCYTSEIFEFYPIQLSSDENDLITITAMEKGIDAIKAFNGQSSPAVIYPNNLDFTYDKILMNSLLTFLDGDFRTKDERIFQTSVNQSLQFAFYALSTPFSYLGLKIDYGVAISLWVSAFETLAHPVHGDVNSEYVRQLLKKVPWHSNKLRQFSLFKYTGDYFKHGILIFMGVLSPTIISSLIKRKQEYHYNSRCLHYTAVFY